MEMIEEFIFYIILIIVLMQITFWIMYFYTMIKGLKDNG